jgi:uncharacterized protein YkwD
MGNVRIVPGNRRPSPGLLLLALVLVCAAPLGVAAATGLDDGKAPADQLETAGDDPQQAAATRAGDSGGDSGQVTTASENRGPPPTGIADIPPPGRAPSTTAGTTPTEASPGTAAPTTTTAGPPATPAPAPSPSPVDEILALVNDARAHAATPCAPLQLDPRLMAAAQAHSDDMAARNFFDHTNPDGVGFKPRILAAGYPEVALVGENIAKGQRSASQVMRDWMESTRHRENIVNCTFNFIGIGLNRTAWTWTQDFAA